MMTLAASVADFLSIFCGFASSLVLLVTPFKARSFKAVVDFSMKPVWPEALRNAAAADKQAAENDLRAISRLEPRYLYAGAFLLALSFFFALVKFGLGLFTASTAPTG